eukprot:COSAG01_NODE_63969_length_278_cov_0.581006_1_plen_48_part_10
MQRAVLVEVADEFRLAFVHWVIAATFKITVVEQPVAWRVKPQPVIVAT